MDPPLPAAAQRHLRRSRLLLIRSWRGLVERGRPATVVLVVGMVTFLVHGYRLSVSPDVFSDEGIYLGVAKNLAAGAGLTLNHTIFLWHPPAYMLFASAYIKIAGLANADPITTLLSVRYLNIFFSASTAALLVLFGRKLHSYKAGLAAAALFLVDPYVQRINRRSMLETLAMLFVLLGLYIFFSLERRKLIRPAWRPSIFIASPPRRLGVGRRLGAGVAFGLAMLTKEAMFLELIALLAYAMWFARAQLKDVAWVAAIACVVYLPYPLWVIAIGRGDQYLFYQLFGVTRVLHSIPGYPPPRVSALPAPRATFSGANLQHLLPQYGMTYVLLLLAAVFTGFLILRFRRNPTARYLATWSIVSFGIGIGLGRTSDQFFYYMIVPSVLVLGYVLASAGNPIWRTQLVRTNWPTGSHAAATGIWVATFAALAVMFMYNSYVWATRYGVASDDAYIGAMRYVQTHVPRGAAIVASDDVAYYFLYPTYNVRLDRKPSEIAARCEHYFIMSSKDAWGRYDLTTPHFYDWVVQSSEPLFVQRDNSFWTIGVYLRRGTTAEERRCSSMSATKRSDATKPSRTAHSGRDGARVKGVGLA